MERDLKYDPGWIDELWCACSTDHLVFFCHNVVCWALSISWAGCMDAKNLPESEPELSGHDAVEDEVDHAVG